MTASQEPSDNQLITIIESGSKGFHQQTWQHLHTGHFGLSKLKGIVFLVPKT